MNFPLIINYLSTFNFAKTLDILTRYTHPTLDRVRDNAYWRALYIEDALALIRVAQADEHHLSISVMQSDGEIHQDALMSKLRYMLGIDDDLSAFYDFAYQHQALWDVVQPLIGVRLIRAVSVFEALIMTITEQQISWVAAQKAQRYLVEWGRHIIHHEGDIFYAFPTVEQFANASLDDLKPMKITFRRMQVIINIAQQIMEDTLDLEAIQHLPIEDAYKALVAIKGIGHWTATWTLSRTHGRHNYVGYNDVALQAAVNRYFYGEEGKIPEAKVTETFAQFGDFAGLAAHYTLMRWVIDRYEAQDH